MAKIIEAREIESRPLDGPRTLTFEKTLRGARGRPVGQELKAATRMGEDFEVVGHRGEVIASGKEGDWLIVKGRVFYSVPREGVGGGPFGLDPTPSGVSYSVVSQELKPKRHAKLEGLLRDLEDTQKAMRDAASGMLEGISSRLPPHPPRLYIVGSEGSPSV